VIKRGGYHDFAVLSDVIGFEQLSRPNEHGDATTAQAAAIVKINFLFNGFVSLFF
jgi:hypothetical protein